MSVNVNYINLKIKRIKILTKKTGLPKFPVISSVEGKSSCKAYFLMSSVMLAQGKSKRVASLNIQETYKKTAQSYSINCNNAALDLPFLSDEKKDYIIIPYIPCTITSIYLFFILLLCCIKMTTCISLYIKYCFENHNTMQFV